MVKILVSSSLIEIEALKSRLEHAGISCFVKNQYTSTLAGEVPFGEVFPELWLVSVDDVQQATDLLDEWRASSDTTREKWTCETCGERHGQQFTHCWNCGNPQA
jgi:hypothetical protein